MKEAELKLEKIKKSCNITAKVAFVLEIFLIVATVLCIVGSIICFSVKDEINNSFSSSMQQEELNEMKEAFGAVDNISFGGAIVYGVNTETFIEKEDFGSLFGIYCIFGAVVCVMVTAIFDMLRRIFKTIKTSETPFDEVVIAKVKRLFIIICVELLLMSGVGMALLIGLICWSVYNILDYGFTIQKQYDETL